MSLFYTCFGDICKYSGLLLGIYSVINSSETNNSSRVGVGLGLAFYLLGNYIVRMDENEKIEKMQRRISDLEEELENIPL